MASDDRLREAVAGLGIPARDLGVYGMALRHRSAAPRAANCERLEFVGDSVISTVVSGYLYRRYPDRDEGFLTRVRTHLVKGSTQAAIARGLGLGGLVELSERLDAGGAREDSGVLEDAFEAVAAAVFFDLGYDEAERWIVGVYERFVDLAEFADREVTAREALVATAQRRGDSLSFEHFALLGGRHKVVVRKGIPGSPDGIVVGVGEGSSKKLAMREASLRGAQHYGV